MGKIIHEMGESEFDRMVDERAELKLLRLFATGNPNQSALTTLHIPHHQPQQPTHAYQSYHPQSIALPAPPQPPALPPAPLPPTYPATAIQDGTVIQTQATVIPPSPPRTIASATHQQIAIPPRAPRFTKRQQRAIAIIAGIAASLWVMDAIVPGLPGRVLSGVQSLYQDAPTMPTTEAPATEPEASSTTEPTPEATPAPSDSAQEQQTFNAPPDIVERIREAGRKPAAPTQ